MLLFFGVNVPGLPGTPNAYFRKNYTIWGRKVNKNSQSTSYNPKFFPASGSLPTMPAARPSPEPPAPSPAPATRTLLPTRPRAPGRITTLPRRSHPARSSPNYQLTHTVPPDLPHPNSPAFHPRPLGYQPPNEHFVKKFSGHFFIFGFF